MQSLGIEADLILFHPYDHWGYALMPPEVDDRYLRYVVARLAAFRNVWWSVANEWDFVKGKKIADWDRYFRILLESDPYGRLRSIHHSGPMYDPTKPWVTHVSIQGDDFSKIPEWRSTFRKPLVFDECKYEGNIPKRWGDISAREMTRRFWLGMANGAYVGHGETYLDPHDILWWSKGGVLHGESPRRIAFLRGIIESGPRRGRCAGRWRVLSLHRPPGRILPVFPGFPPARAGRFRSAFGRPVHRGDHRSLGDDHHKNRGNLLGQVPVEDARQGDARRALPKSCVAALL